jgi:hypothetical protein
MLVAGAAAGASADGGYGGHGGYGNSSGYGNNGGNGNNGNGNTNNSNHGNNGGNGNNGNGNTNGNGNGNGDANNGNGADNGGHRDHGHHNQHQNDQNAVFVSPSGQPSNGDGSCDDAQYSTIQSAVNAAAPGATVIVCQGTYNEDPIVSTPLTLKGEDAVINATTTTNGMCDQLGHTGPGSAPCFAGVTIKSSNVSISGFTVQNAVGEGILATGSLIGGSISNVSITDNRVLNNNTGGIPPTPNAPYPQCSAFGQAPGDCGEGIHLMAVTKSEVGDNYVSGNEGGILLTDEFGPTHDNVIENNIVTGNQFDCGITVPGHNPHALDASGNPQPTVAGVFNNVIRFNSVTDNGLMGEGAGVLFANAAAGTASYDNTVEFNYLAGNELSGVTMHAHTLAPGQFEDLSGNQIIGNVIGQNNLGSPEAGPGDGLDGPPAVDPLTTGILVFSASVPVQVTIADNHVFDNNYGMWFGINGHVNASMTGNTFHHDTVPVFTFS